MSEELTVTVTQPVTQPGELAENVLRHAAAVVAAGARIVVFPELSLTGYDLDAHLVDPADPRLAPLEVACARTGSLALAGAPVGGDGGPFIAMLAIGAGGDDQRARTRIVYRKRWLGDQEAARFQPGDGPTALDVDGWRVALGICKDTGEGEHVQGVVALEPDLYVAGLVDTPDWVPEQERRAQLIAASAGVPVAFAASASGGRSGYEVTSGRSRIWSATGELLADAGTEPGATASATLSRA